MTTETTTTQTAETYTTEYLIAGTRATIADLRHDLAEYEPCDWIDTRPVIEEALKANEYRLQRLEAQRRHAGQIDEAAALTTAIGDITNAATDAATLADFTTARRHHAEAEKIFDRLIQIGNAAESAAEEATATIDRLAATAARDQIRQMRRSALDDLDNAMGEIRRLQRKEAQAAADAIEHITAGGTMVTEAAGTAYTAGRQTLEHIAGRPVYGPWYIHSAAVDTDAAGLDTFETFSDLLIAMAEIARASEWLQP